MHIGRGDRPFKTEYVFFPHQSELFLLSKSMQYKSKDTNCIAPRKEKKNMLSLEQMDKLYDDSYQTNRIEIEDGFIDFTKHFKYLGSFHTYLTT